MVVIIKHIAPDRHTPARGILSVAWRDADELRSFAYGWIIPGRQLDDRMARRRLTWAGRLSQLTLPARRLL